MDRFGVRLENDPTLIPQDYQELSAQAERNGFEAVWVLEGGGRDSLTSLAAIALKSWARGSCPYLLAPPPTHGHGRGRNGCGVW